MSTSPHMICRHGIHNDVEQDFDSASERLAQALLELLASEMWLDRRGEEYHLADAGREIANGAQARMERLVAPLDPIPANDVAKLEGLLHRIIDASLQTPTQSMGVYTVPQSGTGRGASHMAFHAARGTSRS